MKEARIYEEDAVIPTYEAGAADRNPMFLEKRVYQGSSGKVYPYPTTETISPVRKDKTYKAVWLENEYIKVMILPELGGRIQRAYDKTNDYDFVYYNHVIKPALVGLAGPWISGGIEFNWPQHHRPTTFMPVDYLLKENADGSKSLLVNDVDQMYGTKGIAVFTIYPGRAYIEIKGQLYNRTPLPQTFLWWANPAVAVNDNTQSIFPPDVHFVMDHGKRDVSRFPIARGTYYKHDYSEGVDISRYKNIPVPTSFMAAHSDYDFVGGYDYGKEAGLLHVADHHVSPGKKQWTWGNGDFGKAWDRNLTDEDGPYIELMTGVFTENQPDFTWLKPFEEKSFKQYFMPYKKAGAVKNATIRGALNVTAENGRVNIVVYATQLYEEAKIVLKADGKVILEDEAKISPVDVYEASVACEADKNTMLEAVVSAKGKTIVSYRQKDETIEEFAEPAQPAKLPEEIRTNEELLLTARHIEQHRHATWAPDPYYLEGLKRDRCDSQINTAYGLLLMRRGLIRQSEQYFRNAIKRLTWRSPNPYNSEAYYDLGLNLFLQERLDEAYDAFYKATWSNEQQEMSFYYLALIASRNDDPETALEHVERSLIKNSHNIRARGLKASLLRRLGRVEEARLCIQENLQIDPFDYMSRFEETLMEEEPSARLAEMNHIMRDFAENYLMIGRDYADAGNYDEAIAILNQCTKDYPLLFFLKGYCYAKKGDMDSARCEYRRGEQACPDYCFPNKLEDIAVLENALELNPEGAKAPYYLGCLYYDKLQFEQAIALWKRSAEKDDSFATVHRNLSIALYNKKKDSDGARREMERAFALDETDARVLLELDQLYKKLDVPFEERLRHLEAHRALVEKRDDMMLEYVTLLNLTEKPQKAYETIMAHHFRPWEGAEGKISGQYKIALTALAREQMAKGDMNQAKQLLEQALVYPENLGEGRLEGTRDNNIHYYLGLVNRELGEAKAAKAEFELAMIGDNEPAGVMYYYDQPADMILFKGLAAKELGDEKAASACFNRLMDYGERHLNETVTDDFFAVSLPDFLIFDADLTQKNRAHCHYLMGLAHLGMGNKEAAAAAFEKAMQVEYCHQHSRIYLKDAR